MEQFDNPRLFKRHSLIIRFWVGFVFAAVGVTIGFLAYALAQVLFWAA